MPIFPPLPERYDDLLQNTRNWYSEEASEQSKEFCANADPDGSQFRFLKASRFTLGFTLSLITSSFSTLREDSCRFSKNSAKETPG